MSSKLTSASEWVYRLPTQPSDSEIEAVIAAAQREALDDVGHGDAMGGDDASRSREPLPQGQRIPSTSGSGGCAQAGR